MEQLENILITSSQAKEENEIKTLLIEILAHLKKGVNQNEYLINQKKKLPTTYTLEEVAQILKIKKNAVQKKIIRGELKYIPGRVPLILEKQLFNYLKSLQPALKLSDLSE